MRQRAAEVETILDRAESLLIGGDAEGAVAACEQALALAPDHPGALFVRGDGLRAMGQMAEAAQSYRAAALARPEHAASWSSLALTAFEMLDLGEARRTMQRALREDPRNAQAWWVRGLIREHAGDYTGAERALKHAAWLDPDGFPLPPSLDEDELETLVEECLTEMPPSLREVLSNIAILIEEVPSTDVLCQYDPPASPLSMLGFFSGPSLMDRGAASVPWRQLPANIILFRRNLQRFAVSRQHLIEELRLTLLHEVGHFLGLDEADLEARGLD